MTALVMILLTLTVLAVALAALRDIYDDGYGRRQPPASHHLDQFDPHRT